MTHQQLHPHQGVTAAMPAPVQRLFQKRLTGDNGGVPQAAEACSATGCPASCYVLRTAWQPLCRQAITGDALLQAEQAPLPEATPAQRIEAGMAVLRNNLPGLSQGSLRDMLERAHGDVMQALSGLAQHELAAPIVRAQVRFCHSSLSLESAHAQL